MLSSKGYRGQSLKNKILVGQGDTLNVAEMYVFHPNITGGIGMFLFITGMHLPVLNHDIIKPILEDSE